MGRTARIDIRAAVPALEGPGDAIFGDVLGEHMGRVSALLENGSRWTLLILKPGRRGRRRSEICPIGLAVLGVVWPSSKVPSPAAMQIGG
jgi:hypothetical protein